MTQIVANMHKLINDLKDLKNHKTTKNIKVTAYFSVLNAMYHLSKLTAC